jgi:hypothetical protein
MPSVRTHTAASAGPTARARLYVIAFSATAAPSCSRGTRSPINAIDTGAANALPMPSTTAHAITTHTRARPAQASPASAALIAVDPSCVTSSSRLRSKRSAALPAHGASSSTGTKLQKLRTPSRNAECVSR